MLRTSLFVQVVRVLVFGVIAGRLRPDFGADVQPLGDGFVRLVKTMIAPLVFCVVTGIAKAGDLKAFGRIGAKALVWFEVASTLALLIALLAANLATPGGSMHANPSALDAGAASSETRWRCCPASTGS